MQIVAEAKEKILKSTSTIARLMILFNRGERSIRNWVMNSEEILQLPKAQAVFAEELNLSFDEVWLFEQLIESNKKAEGATSAINNHKN